MFLLIPVQNIKLQLNVSVCLLVKEVEVFRKTAEFKRGGVLRISAVRLVK